MHSLLEQTDSTVYMNVQRSCRVITTEHVYAVYIRNNKNEKGNMYVDDNMEEDYHTGSVLLFRYG